MSNETATATTEPATTETATPATTISTPPPSQETTSTSQTSESGSESEPDSSAGEAAQAPAIDFDALTLPEGATIPDEDRAALTEIAAAHGLTQDAVAALAEYHFSKLGSTAETLNGQIEEAWTTTNKEWREATLAQFGGDEAAATKAAGRFQPIIDRFGGDELREALAVTGAGNHPAVFSFFAKLAETLGEPSPVAANAVASSEDPLMKFYPNSPGLFKGAKS